MACISFEVVRVWSHIQELQFDVVGTTGVIRRERCSAWMLERAALTVSRDRNWLCAGGLCGAEGAVQASQCTSRKAGEGTGESPEANESQEDAAEKPENAGAVTSIERVCRSHAVHQRKGGIDRPYTVRTLPVRST